MIAVGTADTVSLFEPDGRLLGAQRRNQQAGISADGFWQAGQSCPGQGAPCQLLLSYRGGTFQPVPLPAAVKGGTWSDTDARFALMDTEDRLYILDPSVGIPASIATGVTAYAWTGRGALTLVSREGSSSTFWRADGSTVQRLASVDGAVSSLYRSPANDQVAFVTDAPDGWRFLVLDLQTAALTDFGNLGRLPERDALITQAPAIAIAWSPDQRLIAVSPVAEPYVLYLLDRGGTILARHFFAEGYAGELKWSPEGSTLAVSTYSADRSRHEVYVVETSAQAAPRRLLDGCLIQWSPDGRFLAVKREPARAAGVAAVRVADGLYWPVVGTAGALPLGWGDDEASALRLSERPVRSAAVLNK